MGKMKIEAWSEVSVAGRSRKRYLRGDEAERPARDKGCRDNKVEPERGVGGGRRVWRRGADNKLWLRL